MPGHSPEGHTPLALRSIRREVACFCDGLGNGTRSIGSALPGGAAAVASDSSSTELAVLLLSSRSARPAAHLPLDLARLGFLAR